MIVSPVRAALLLMLVSPLVRAGTLYRCEGDDGVPHFVQVKIPNARCKAVGQLPAVAAAKPAPAPVPDAPKASPSAPPADEGDAAQQPSVQRQNDGTRISRGAIYKKQVDGVNVYTNVGGKGAGSLHSRYYVIEKCYACGDSGINFGKVKLNLQAYGTEIRAASLRFGVDEAIVRAIIHAESAYRPNALSRAGAQGLMQLIPATARRFGVKDPFDPGQNIQGGVEYLAWLLKRYKNDLTLASAAYNAGEGAVDRYKGVPPYKETRNYVVRVGQLAERYRKALNPG